MPDFSSDGFKKRASGIVTRHYRDREVVFSEGDTADSMFRVLRGYVKLTMAGTKGGRKAAIAILSSGDCFGESCLRDSLRTCTAASVRQSTVERVGKGTMLRRLRTEPPLGKLLISHLFHRIHRAESDVANHLVNSSQVRLARLLLVLSRFGRPGAVPVLAGIDQGTLAQVVGTTRSRVSYFMNQFRRKGLIAYTRPGELRVNKALHTFATEAG